MVARQSQCRVENEGANCLITIKLTKQHNRSLLTIGNPIIMRMKRFFSSSHNLAAELLHGCNNYSPRNLTVVRAQGPFLYCQKDQAYFDCITAEGAASIGHCHPALLEALLKQAQTLCITSRAFYNNKLGLFQQKICQLTGFQKVLMMNTGVQACQSSIKLARRWAIRKKHIPEPTILFAKGAGMGFTIASCAASPNLKREVDFGPYQGMNFKQIEFGNIGELQTALEADPTISAFMVEPIQSEGGIVVPPSEYLRNCRQLLAKHNSLLICDQAQTGLGRTGALLSSQGADPDIVALGKSLGGGVYPVSAVLAKSHIMDLITPGQHGSTFGGNPLACAVAESVLKLVPELAKNSATQGAYLLSELSRIFKPTNRVEVRGRGLLIGLDFKNNTNLASEFCDNLCHNGVLAKPTWGQVVRIMPVLSLTEAETKLLAEKIQKAWLATVGH